MMGQFAVTTIRLALPRVMALCIVVGILLASLSLSASVLRDLQPVYVAPGDLLVQQIQWDRQSGKRIEIKLLDAPPSARLSLDPQGELQIKWQTAADLPDESLLVVIARDLDSKEQVDRRYLIVRNAQTRPVTSESSSERPEYEVARSRSNNTNNVNRPVSEASDESDVPVKRSTQADAGEPATVVPEAAPVAPVLRRTAPAIVDMRPDVPQAIADSPVKNRIVSAPAPPMAPSPETPPVLSQATVNNEFVRDEDLDNKDHGVVLEAIANQIVSVGRIVSFKAVATAADTTLPELNIDRLPRNASFERNRDGSYTFFWQTGSRDQGEHRFRIMAKHAADAHAKISQDVTIVIGNPAAATTIPEDFPDAGS